MIPDALVREHVFKKSFLKMDKRQYQRKKMREWRAVRNNTFKKLRTEANTKDATTSAILKYTKVFKERNYFLQKEKERVKLYRQKLKIKYSHNDPSARKQKQNKASMQKTKFDL